MKKTAEKLNASVFHFSDSEWDDMVKAGVDMWEMNKKFLNESIKNGDEIILSRSYDKVRNNSALMSEIKHVLENGYDWKDAAKTSLIPKK